MSKLCLGFASFKDGTFELIVSDRENFREVTLKGQMKDNPPLSEIDEVLPTCVFVSADAANFPRGWFRMLCEANESLVEADSFVDGDADGHLLEFVDQLVDPAQDDDCKLYLFTQSQLLKLMRTITGASHVAAA